MMRRRHIAIVTSGLGAGGAERVIALIADHLVARGDRVSVIAFDRPDDPIFHPLPEGATIHRLGATRRSAIEPLARIMRLRRLLAAAQPDIVLSLLTKINAITLLATIGLPARVIPCERNNPTRQDAHPIWNLALRLLYRRATAIVLQTAASRRCLPRGVRGRATVIPNPIEPYAVPTQDPLPSRLAAVGRLTHQKGFDLLIDAYARVADRHPAWQLDIWGEGDDRATLASRIATLGMADRIALRGLSATPGGWLAEAGALVLSSRYEGFPNVLAEAMAAGLPVLATDCAFGPAELIVPERTGLLIPAENVATLAIGLDRLLGDDALRSRIGTAARAAMRAYAPSTVLARWDALLDAVARPRRKAKARFIRASSYCHLPARRERS